MTPESQRIALAKWAGLDPQDIPLVPNKANLKGWFTPDGALAIYNAYPHGSSVRVIPDYLHDLNAVHELEEKLKTAAEAMQFAVELSRLVGKPFQPARELGLWEGWKLAHATADQRCEALLKTLGLWEA